MRLAFAFASGACGSLNNVLRLCAVDVTTLHLLRGCNVLNEAPHLSDLFVRNLLKFSIKSKVTSGLPLINFEGCPIEHLLDRYRSYIEYTKIQNKKQ